MTQTNKHTVAILGGGARGRDHLDAFLQNADRFDVVALCDKDGDRLKLLSASCPGAKTYADAERMLAETKPDVFCFATLPTIRLPLIELGVKYGAKAIAYEKPMALTLAEARRIHDLCAQAGVKTIVSHQHKYGEHWRKVRDLAASGEIGQVHTVHATAKGALLQYGAHLVDYMMFLNGGHRADWVIGQVNGKKMFADSHPSPDYVLGHFAFANGVRGILECGNLAPDQPGNNSFWMNAGATVYGSDGYAQVIVGAGWRAVTRSSGGLITGPGCFSVKHDQPLYIRDLAEWLDDPAKVHPCNGETSYHGIQIVLGMCLSSLERRQVALPIDTDTPVMARLAAEM